MKGEFTPPTDVIDLWHTYCTEANALHRDFQSLNLKLHIEAVRTLLCVYAYHKCHYSTVTAPMIAKITKISIGSEYRKLHIMAGKEILKEDHSMDPGRVLFLLTDKTIERIEFFIGGLLD